MFDSVIARSFGRHEQKRLGYGATICCLIIIFFFCTSVKPYLGFVPNVLNVKVSMGIGLKMLAQINPSESLNEEVVLPTNKIQPVVLCNTEEPRTEYCEIKTYARIDAKSASVFAAYDSLQVNNDKVSFINATIKPYARKGDNGAMMNVRKWTVRSLMHEKGLTETLQCTQNHAVPALLFSFGGYIGNNFHEFSDVVIPLFITSRLYKKEVQFLITDYKLYGGVKYQNILKGLSNYEPLDIDKENQHVHCFPSAVVGLKGHERELAINSEKYSTSMKEFREFLRNSFSINKEKVIAIKGGLQSKKPRLLILSRRKSRSFTNTEEIGLMARVLGFDVIISEAGPDLSRLSKLVSSCDVLMGVHGAGLTNMIFLPDNAVFIQVIPIGGLEWLAKTDYAVPSKGMNLRYLEYKISIEESTLINQYPIDHEVFKGSYSIQKYGWIAFKRIVMDKQNVNLDVNRFKPTLVKALELLS